MLVAENVPVVRAAPVAATEAPCTVVPAIIAAEPVIVPDAAMLSASVPAAEFFET
jgi:hypothetical protein